MDNRRGVTQLAVVVIAAVIVSGIAGAIFLPRQFNDGEPSGTETTTSESEQVRFENPYFRLSLLDGWRTEELPGGAVKVSKGNYDISVYPKADPGIAPSDTTTLIGAMSGPKLTKKFNYWSSCGTYTEENLTSVLTRVDEFVKADPTNGTCNFPSDGNVHWYLSLVSTGERYEGSHQLMYVGEPTKVSPISHSACDFSLEQSGCGFLIAMSYNTTSINNLPVQGSPELTQMLGEMSTIIKTIQFKEQPVATKPLDVSCQIARFGEYKLGVSPNPVQITGGELKEFGVKTEWCSDLNDLNGDGKTDALVVFRTTDPLGGTGIFYDVAVVSAHGGSLRNIATKSLPDRSGFGGYEFDSGNIILYLHPWEGKQLPWRKVTYHLEGNKLQEISTQLFDFVYTDPTYGFTMTFPSEWKGMSITKTSGDYGVDLAFKHPTVSSRQPVLIGIYSHEIWEKIEKEEIMVSAAPFNPGERGRNNKWVFALPPRWVGYADTTYQDEAKIIAGSLTPFNL